jgi:hypothetical protein
MKKNSTHHELEILKNALKQFSEGASPDEIRRASGLDIPLRTLQRRLASLLEQGEVWISGHTRSRRYHLIYSETENRNRLEESEPPIPLSPAGQEIRALVTRPIQQRKPVGYNSAFLNRYKPNKDGYLTQKELQQLARIGRTTGFDQPAGTYAREILNRLLIDLSWNSSRLEGNTYSLLDTERLLSLGEAADGKSAAEAQMILNHKDAIEFIVQATEDIGFNRYTLLNLHALLSNNLLADPAASGRLRSFGVGIHHSVYTPLAIPQQIEEMFNIVLKKAEQIKDPFEQAFFIMVQLPYLQPFDDVNKRVSRLAANIPLTRHNRSPLSFIDVPTDLYIQGILGVYELNRVELLKDVFIWAYERSAARYARLRQSLGEPDPFRLRYREQMRTLIMHIVSAPLMRKEATDKIKEAALYLPEPDQSRFIEAVETELLSLHEGNFARYRITPSQFRKWEEAWQRRG